MDLSPEEMALIREALRRMATTIYRCKSPHPDQSFACQQLADRFIHPTPTHGEASDAHKGDDR